MVIAAWINTKGHGWEKNFECGTLFTFPIFMLLNKANSARCRGLEEKKKQLFCNYTHCKYLATYISGNTLQPLRLATRPQLLVDTHLLCYTKKKRKKKTCSDKFWT